MRRLIQAGAHLVESKGDQLAHIVARPPAYGERPEVACGRRSFPYDWHRTGGVKRPVCPTCIAACEQS